MFEAMDVLNAFAAPLKVSWVAWLVWGVGQYVWFRHERSKPMKKAVPAAQLTARKPSPRRQAAAPAGHAPASGPSARTTHVAADTTPTAPENAVAPIAEARPEPTVPAVTTPVLGAPATPTFDPARAVIEQFGASNENALDKFVRDFSMQDARPERRGPPVPDPACYDVGTPSAP